MCVCGGGQKWARLYARRAGEVGWGGLNSEDRSDCLELFASIGTVVMMGRSRLRKGLNYIVASVEVACRGGAQPVGN